MRPSTHAHALSAFPLFLSFLFTTVVKADRTTEGGEAGISDPNQECTSYGYGPVTNAINSGMFPTLLNLEIADILPNDGAAAAKWASIQANVPNIAPKNISLNVSAGAGEPDYPPSDPDCWWSFTKCTTPKASGLQMDVATVPEPQTLGYGFDDGPFCGHNPFYDFLSSQNQKATMFYIGSNVMNFPLEAQRAIVDGHEICVHTWSHHYMTSLTSSQAFAELYYTMESIKLVTGVTPTCWRPPYGDIDDRIRAIASGLGLRTIIWTYDSNDWQLGFNGITATQIDANYQQLIDLAGNGTFATQGTIMLTHELTNFTMSEAVKFYPMLKTAFQHLVPVGVALNQTKPYLEAEYSLPTFAQYIAGTIQTGSNTINANDTVLAPLVANTVVSSSAQSTPSSGSSSGSSSPGSNKAAATSNGQSPTSTGSSAQTTHKSSAGRMHVGVGALFLCLASILAL